jgi:NADPH:quinone reductase-like Zn-dependent oxidoreductase
LKEKKVFEGVNGLRLMHDVGVSPLDDKVRGGILPPTMRKPLPLVPGASAVGRVADPGASGHAPGTRVLL